MLQARPGHVGLLPERLLIRLSSQGRLENAVKLRPTAAVLRVQDVFAVTWEVHEPRELEQLMRQRVEQMQALEQESR